MLNFGGNYYHTRFACFRLETWSTWPWGERGWRSNLLLQRWESFSWKRLDWSSSILLAQSTHGLGPEASNSMLLHTTSSKLTISLYLPLIHVHHLCCVTSVCVCVCVGVLCVCGCVWVCCVCVCTSYAMLYKNSIVISEITKCKFVCVAEVLLAKMLCFHYPPHLNVYEGTKFCSRYCQCDVLSGGIWKELRDLFLPCVAVVSALY